nr:highly reducing polyketide synthase [Pseudogymnoascus verrucosus]
MSSLRLISTSGKSYSFDSRASGYGRGEGSATVILKRLEDALRDNDPIRAVIRGSGCNQDGKTDTITTPSQIAQEVLMRKVYETSGLNPTQTTYFEAHGTGTPTGDPIECRAVASVFQDSRPRDEPLRIGSVKANVGHTETTSGLASIIKVALALENNQIPPSANFENPNPDIDFETCNLKVPTQLEPWTKSGDIRRASVNNFGYGGANAHIIMEDYQSFVSSTSDSSHLASQGITKKTTNDLSNGTTNGITNDITNGITNGTNEIANVTNGYAKFQPKVIILSAKDEPTAQVMVQRLKDHILATKRDDEKKFLCNLSYTLGQRRSRFLWVAAQPVKSIEHLIEVIESGKMKPLRSGMRPKLGFVFTGQGAQWYAMGRELIEVYPVFKACLLEADRHLRDFGSTWSLMEELSRDEKTSRVNELVMSMPLCASIQIALVRLLRSWDIVPTGVTSHSSGEIAAAYAAGVLTLQSAMAIVFARSSLAAEVGNSLTRNGGMLAVGLSAKDVTENYLPRVKSGNLVVACLNSPTSITASGDVVGIEELEVLLKQDSVFARRLKVDAAYHSHHMQDIAAPYLEWLQRVFKADADLDEGVIYTSPTTGEQMTSGKELCKPEHWVQSLVSPVQFTQAFTKMCLGKNFDANGTPDVDAIIEVGPHAALGGPIAELIAQAAFKENKIPYHSCLVRKSNAVETMQAVAAGLLCNGYPVNMNAVNFPTGALAIGTNMLAPTWRLIIRPSELPWVRDHVVQGSILYPGAGFICMAIEGACQAAQETGNRISGYQLHDIDISAALVVPDTIEGIEVQLTLRQCSDKSTYGRTFKEFHIYSVTGENKWTEHCKGLIAVDFKSADETDEAQWGRSRDSISKLVGPRKMGDYRRRLDPRDIYGSMRSVGIYHGPIFQNLKSIRARTEQSVSVFEIADTVAVMPYQQQHKHVLDPTTLDTIFQAAYTALPEAGSKMSTAFLPRSIKRLWVAHSITSNAGHRFRAYSDIKHSSVQSFETDIAVTNDADESINPVMTVVGFVFQSLGSASLSQTAPNENEKFATVRWGADITMAKSSFWKQKLSYPVDLIEVNAMMDLKRLSIRFMAEALAALTIADIKQMTSHSKRLYVWIKRQAELASLNKLASNSAEWINGTPEDTAMLMAEVNAASVNGELLCHTAPYLTAILKGDIASSDLAVDGQLLSRYFTEATKWDRSNRQVGELVKLFVHLNPRAKILEIGAGAGGTTMYSLNAIGTEEDGGSHAASYDFTDTSSECLGAAAEKFGSWKDLVRYMRLDIEQNPANQGFENGTYDLVIAGQALYGIRSKDTAIANVRMLLKPGGKLFMTKTTQDQLDMQLAFGLLGGSLQAEAVEGQENQSSPPTDTWDLMLRSNGFTGVDIEEHDCESEEHYSVSVMVSTATASPPKIDIEVVLVTANHNTPPSWLNQLSNSICTITGKLPSIEHLESATGDGKVVIFLGELDQSILKDPSLAQFEAIRSLCTKSKGLLWVTRGGAVDHEDIYGSLHVGFLRTVRVEYVGKRFASLDLDPKQELWADDSVATLTDVFKKVFNFATEDYMNDYEFAERDGVIQIPRYYKDIQRNKATFPDPALQVVPLMEPFSQENRPLRLSVGTIGVLESLAFDDDPDAANDLPTDFLEVKPQAFGLNYRDVKVAMGQLHDAAMGSECSGIITRVGLAARLSGFKEGDRVAMLSRGHYANLVRQHWTSAVHIPDDMSFEVAAAIPISYSTAYLSLFNTARLKKGEAVIIHSAAGSIGQAAIALAKYVGAEVFATVENEIERDFLVEKYGIDSDHILSNRDSSFSSIVLALTRGKGVDVVLNNLPGSLMREAFDCIAPFGRFIEVGRQDVELNGSLEMSVFSRSVSFSSIDLLTFAAHKGQETALILKAVMSLFRENAISHITPTTAFALPDFEVAFRLMQAGTHMGKIVLLAGPDDLIPVLPHIPKAKLRADSSYLIVGGLGGIGRSICYWMADHGAKSLIVLSRSANAEEKSRSFIDEMAKAGCKVKAVGCDVSDEDALVEALGECNQDMPPIRGVIQGAMLLKDSVLEQMTLEDYTGTIRPKVQGSWNLHQLFSSQDLDFFIMLSSLAGVFGIVSQCNYSAGGTFEDALARYRTLRGLPGVSIDVGVVKSVGVVAENKGIDERLRKSGHTLLSENDVCRAIESAIISPPSTPLMLGLNPGPGPHWEESGMARDLRFAPIKYRQAALNVSCVSKTTEGLAGQISTATSFEEAVDIVIKGISNKLMEIFMISEIVPSYLLSDYGVDSLVAVELRNMLALKAGAEVSIFDIMQSASVAALATKVASKSTHINPSFITV